jgi:hypothetical protein
MRKILTSSVVASALVLALVAPASAGGAAGSVGVGAEYMLRSSVGGISLNFDGGTFHAGGFVGFTDNPPGPDNSILDLGGRFFYHLHATAMSDFGVGGALGFRFVNGPGDDDRTELYFDLGAQIRAFIASNVALSATLGVGIGAADASGVIFAGEINGGLGIHYYFF